MKRIYIATSRSNVLSARRLASSIRALGHTVTSRWIDYPDVALGAPEHAMTQKERERICNENHRDIMDANVLVLLAHKDCRGALVEFGLAYTGGIRVYIVGDRNDVSLMTNLRDVNYAADEKAFLVWLKKQETEL